ncbi:TetR family transcriptional regulator [Agrobacterium vitis]|uniref:TetR family transcriptional regulator n=1 Tax=Agrobacterium vitis TaxID=373 RepID=UPI003D2BD001
MKQPNELGRRERKKQELRQALVDAAYELFEKLGFDQTRIEDITDKVDVSTRTFFRYFASKEEVVLDYDAVEQQEIVAALIARPTNESILTALRQAAVEVTKACEEGFYGVDGDRFRTLRSLIRTHPLIQARRLEQAKARKEVLVSVIAQRLNLDQNQDIRPLVIAGILEFVSSAAFDAWQSFPSRSVPYSKMLDEVFQLAEDGLNLK